MSKTEKLRDHRFLRWMLRGDENEIPKSLMPALWRARKSRLVRINDESQIYLTAAGKVAAGKVARKAA